MNWSLKLKLYNVLRYWLGAVKNNFIAYKQAQKTAVSVQYDVKIITLLFVIKRKIRLPTLSIYTF